MRVWRTAAWSALLISAEGCGPRDYATWVERRDATAIGSPAATPIVDPALLAHWRFDDGAGSVVADSSGGGHDGTLLTNGASPVPVWTTGKVGGALTFDGQSFVRVPYSGDWDKLVATNAFSLVAWVNRQTTPGSWNTVVSRQYQGSNREHFNLGFRTDHIVPVANTQLNEFWYCTAPAASVNGLWVHVAGSYDGTTLRAYENGIEVCSLGFVSMFTTDSTGIIIGGEVNGAGPTVDQFFTGLVDDLAIYSRALGPSEIAELAAGKPIASGTKR